jgi:hypothetical protein
MAATQERLRAGVAVSPEVRYFAGVHAAFEEAARTSSDASLRTLRIGDASVCIRFAARGVADAVMPALAHLDPAAADAPGLTVCVWDGGAGRRAVPPPPWTADDYVARGDIRGWSAGRIRAAYHLGTGTLSLLDVDRGVALHWIRDLADFPTHERSAPLRTLLSWWMGARGGQLVHGGAIGRPSGGVLLAGRSGRGKSTAALACLGSALRYAGDDYVAVRTAPTPHLYSLYNSAKLERAHLARTFPALRPLLADVAGAEAEKALLFVHERYPGKPVADFPLRAILLPEVGERTGSHVRDVSPALVLRELAASTMSQLPGSDPDTLHRLAALVRAVPCHVLEIGSDPSRAAAAVERLLA